MKIALLTIWHERNYGAEMQTYATVRVFRELGHEVKVIDIRLADVRKYSLKGRIGKCIEFFSPAEKMFQKFWKQRIPTTCRYRSIAELQAYPPQADIYLVGSDQVWNPQITQELAPIFFLNFGDEKVKRISYASSFGRNIWDGDSVFTKLVKIQLRKFSAISCRESTGCSILKNTFGIDAQCVLDPTLLHSDYKELIGEVVDKPTLAFYPLSPDLELENYTKKLAQHLHLEWVDTNNKQFLIGKVIWQRNSIEQWISAIASAQLVITRSFHGLAFCLIYHRQFIVINNSDRSSRLTDLLAQLGLSNRCFSSIEEIDRVKPWKEKINYTEIDKRLYLLKTNSYNYLKTMFLFS